MAKKASKPIRKTKSNKRISSIKTLTKKQISIFVLLFALVGGFILYKSFAATAWWQPTADKPLKLSWVLGGRINFNSAKDMGTVDINGNPIPGGADVFDLDMEYTTTEDVTKLHSMGKKVICYFDAGVYETYRQDASKFQAIKPQIWGAADQGWNGSYWLDIRRVSELEPIMKARMDQCKTKGFDGIEPDEITNWSNDNGFDSIVVNGHAGITYQDQIAYNRALAGWAHERGLSIGLKGDLEQAHDLVNDFDWTLNEECIQYSECLTITNAPDKTSAGLWGADGKDYPGVQLFSQKNKAVWIAEYKAIPASGCQMAYNNRFNAALYKLGLPENAGFTPCSPAFPERTTTTPPTPANVNPTVSVSSSSTNVTAPGAFTITANGTDTDGTVTKVDIVLNNNTVATCNAASCTFNASNYAAGTYTFTAKATDNAGGTGSATTTVTVNPAPTPTPPPNVPPTVTLSTSSATSLTAPASFAVTANASDSDGTVSQVQVYLNGTAGAIDTAAPYSFSFTGQPAGTYAVKVVAKDNSGNTTTSNTITFTVTNPVTTGSVPVGPSSISIGSLLRDDWWNGCSWVNNCKVALSWPAATNSPTSYQVKKDGALLGTTTGLQYNAPVTAGYDSKFTIVAINGAGAATNPPSVTVGVGCFLIWCSATAK